MQLKCLECGETTLIACLPWRANRTGGDGTLVCCSRGHNRFEASLRIALVPRNELDDAIEHRTGEIQLTAEQMDALCIAWQRLKEATRGQS